MTTMATLDAGQLASAFQRFERAAVDLRNQHESLQEKVRRLEGELSDANRRLETKRRLEALGRMAAEIAHEVRNPLGSIRLFSEMMREDLREDDAMRETVDHILAATSGLESTVTNLLAFAAPPRTAKSSTDLAAVARDVCALLAPSCELRGVALSGPADGESLELEADTEGMRQVLLNLVGNALAATGEGGAVSVRARRDQDMARLEVRDTGKGIAPEDVPKVFDPFFSRTDGGTGLGLSIVHGVVERHGGRIALHSKPGEGTVVGVDLPFSARDERLEESEDA